jgi:uncharacterized membrane protein
MPELKRSRMDGAGKSTLSGSLWGRLSGRAHMEAVPKVAIGARPKK